MNRFTRAALTVLLALVFPTFSPSLRAQEGAPLEITAKAEVIEEFTGPDGRVRQRFVPAGELAEGEDVFFTLRIRNASSVVAPNVAVTWPIPANTVYEPESATGPAAEVMISADGGRTFEQESQVRIADATGETRTARPAEYTHIRWRLRYPLAPGAVAIVRFRAKFG